MKEKVVIITYSDINDNERDERICSEIESKFKGTNIKPIILFGNKDINFVNGTTLKQKIADIEIVINADSKDDLIDIYHSFKFEKKFR